MIPMLAAAGLTLILALALVRLFNGPTLYDRALAANVVATAAALVCAAFAAFRQRPDLVDAALALVLGGFVVNVAVLKFFRARSFQPPLARAGEGEAS